ncbi:TonB-dependent receptor [Oceanospirillum maris]|uniref:TonB-dependent receptor n=1 Tax=Oceanospirillum maris TaxID=64977 RepID=UPI00040F8EC5|nr:TonB-dependent receptor [Oceanospirillum maris]
MQIRTPKTENQTPLQAKWAITSALTYLLMAQSSSVLAHGSKMDVPDTGIRVSLEVEQHLLSGVSEQNYQLSTPILQLAESPEEGIGAAEMTLALTTELSNQWLAYGAISNHSHGGESSLDIDQGFIQGTAQGTSLEGITLRIGRFYSSAGLYNDQGHAGLLFPTAPLIYQDLMGGELKDDGLSIGYNISPKTKIVLETFAGDNSLSGQQAGNKFSQTHTLHLDQSADLGAWGHLDTKIGYLTSKQNYQSEDSGHSHSNDSELVYQLSGDIEQWMLSMLWQKERWQISGEYIAQDQDTDAQTSSQILQIKDKSSGFYGLVAYQVSPKWILATRYDRLTTDIDTYGHQELISSFGLPISKTPENLTLLVNWQPADNQQWSLHLSQAKDLWQGSSSNNVYGGISYQLSFGGETL